VFAVVRFGLSEFELIGVERPSGEAAETDSGELAQNRWQLRKPHARIGAADSTASADAASRADERDQRPILMED